MIPLKDDIPAKKIPFVNYSLIGVCLAVFALQLLFQNSETIRIEEQFGLVPQRLFHSDEPVVAEQVYEVRGRIAIIQREISAAAIPNWMTLITCMFLHGGWMHIIGNLWILFIFGDNVEDRLGHLGYLLFYMIVGIGAGAAHLAMNSDSPIPTIGASGAIAGVMGAYFLFYPKANVLCIIPILGFVQFATLPAPTFLGFWFVLQLINGSVASLGASGGVAWWAHIGGFAVGAGLAFILNLVHFTSPPQDERRRRFEHVNEVFYDRRYR